MKRTISLVIISIFLFPGLPMCCTIFAWSANGIPLAAANEDWSDPFTKVWFSASTKDKYGSISFGFSDRQVQAAMNEYGLFYDYAAILSIKPKKSNLEVFQGDLLFEIISKCKTVKEAVSYLEKYRFT